MAREKGKKAVSDNAIVEVWLDAKLTRQQAADKVGLTVGGLTQRVDRMNESLVAGGFAAMPEKPRAAGSGRRKSAADLAGIVAKFNRDEANENPTEDEEAALAL